MIPNPSNSLLSNNGQKTFEEWQRDMTQQIKDNKNPNNAQQLIDLLNQSSRAMGMVPGAGAEADQTLQQINPTGPQSMQDMQNMRREIEQERATDEYPFYDEEQLQADFERQKRAEDKQWQGFISSYKEEMKDKISQEHKDHVAFMTATGGNPLNIGEFAQQTGYLGGNKLQEAWEAHKEKDNTHFVGKSLDDRFSKSPLDYVIDNLIAKANLPTMREKGIKFDDIQSLRWLPQTRKDTFSKPISVTRSKKLGAGQVLPYEIDTVAPMPEGITLPGLLDKTKRHINPLMNVSGTWVSPSNQGTLTNPDFTFDPHAQAILLGNINSPNFYRREKEGAKMPGGEGFQYGGFPKDSYFSVQLPQNATPMSIAQVMREKLARENLPPVLQNPNLKLDNETLEFVNQFPEQQGMRSWYQDVGKPLDLQGLIDSNQINRLSESQKILNSPFLPVQTGEPMDLAIDSLLKASMYFGAGENADPKGVRQASLEGHQFASQPAMQQAAQASDARIRDLTGGSQELGTMLSTNQWNPESAWGGQSEETPFRGINLSEYGRRLGLGQFGDDEDTQERKLIDHMGQTATHEATHEAQRLPLNEAFTESIYAGNNPSPQQFTNWDEYGAITSQVGPTPSPNFYPGFTGQQATQALANMHPAIVQTGEPMDLKNDEGDQPNDDGTPIDHIHREPLSEYDGREQHPGRGDEHENIFHQYRNETGLGRNTMLPWFYINHKTKEKGGIPPTDREIMNEKYAARYNGFLAQRPH